MENEVKEEVKVETKKKGNGLFTVFACVMTGAIVFMATNLGDKASKVVDPDTNSGNTTTSNVESNVTSNIESNITSQITSNTTSNVATTTYTGVYNGNVLLNSQNSEYKLYTLRFDENNKVSFSYSMIASTGGSGSSGVVGTYEVKNNKLVVTATEEITTIGTNKLSTAKTVEFTINADGTFTYTDNGKSVVIGKGKEYNGRYSGKASTNDGTYEFALDLNSADNTAKYMMNVPMSEGISFSGTYKVYNDGILFIGSKAYRSGGEVDETNIMYFKANADGSLSVYTQNMNVTLKK